MEPEAPNGHSTEPVAPAEIELDAKVSEYLGSFAKWLFRTRPVTAFDVLGDCDRISQATRYRMLDGYRNWTQESGAALINGAAKVLGKDPRDVLKNLNRGEHRIHAFFNGYLETVFPANHSGERAHRMLTELESASAWSSVLQSVPDFGLLGSDLTAAYCRPLGISQAKQFKFPRFVEELRDFARRRHAHLSTRPAGGPRSRMFLMGLLAFERFVHCQGFFRGLTRRWDIDPVLSQWAEHFVEGERVFFGVYDDRRKSRRRMGDYLDCVAHSAQNAAHTYWFECGVSAERRKLDLEFSAPRPGLRRRDENRDASCPMSEGLLGHLCHPPDPKGAREFIARYLVTRPHSWAHPRPVSRRGGGQTSGQARTKLRIEDQKVHPPGEEGIHWVRNRRTASGFTILQPTSQPNRPKITDE
jgi:hypothetical protein